MSLHNIILSTLSAIALSVAAVPAIAQDTAPSDVPDQPAAVPVDAEPTLPSDADLPAQEDATAQADPAPAQPIQDAVTLAQALDATPPMRSQMARRLAQSPDAYTEIDQWIADTDIDNPKNLVLKDILLAMPLDQAGPRLVELAKKSNDPSIQANWSTWLDKFPDAKANVLVAWLKHAQDNPARFVSLLAQYYPLRPEHALDLWAQQVANHPIKDIQSLYAFGIDKPLCAQPLAARVPNYSDEAPRLRLLRALAHCADLSAIPEDVRPALESTLGELLNHSSPSRRIVALDVVGVMTPHDVSLISRTGEIFWNAKNTTERAVAMRALAHLNPEAMSGPVAQALATGDETLRLEAAALIAGVDGITVPHEAVRAAFDAEIWPETQMYLYRALAKDSQDPQQLDALRKTVLLDGTRAQHLRMAMLHDLGHDSPQSLTLDDMATLMEQDAPIELIAGIAEQIYASNPAARPDLRAWLDLQQPFERRLQATFVRFMRIDAANNDPSSIEFMRKICGSEQPHESILQPCIIYFESTAQDSSDAALLERLKHRQVQFDAMMNIDF